MASKTAECDNICLVCLETRPLKIAGRCKHSLCAECLSTAMGRADGDLFSCPTCQADCPLPWDGVEGLVDFTGEELVVEELGKVIAQGRKEGRDDKVIETVPGNQRRDRRKKTPNGDQQMMVDVKCMICHHKKRDVQAVNLCVECRNLHICQDCTEVHARNKATQRHVVICFRPEMKEEETMCEKHDSALDGYCHDCKQAVCVVCVMLEHGDHTLDKLADMVEVKIKELKVIAEDKVKRLEKLQELEKDLALLTRMTVVVDKQDILIKEIEDRAEKCIGKIVKWKEGLKGKVKADYQIICDIPECLKKVSEMVQKLQKPIKRAGSVLDVPEHKLVYHDRLLALQQEFENLGETRIDGEGAGYADQLQELHSSDCGFKAITRGNAIGKVVRAQAKKEEFAPKQIFKLTMPTDSNDKFIPCVANLGQNFVVAHPTRQGEPSDAVDIYEFPRKLKHSFKEHVPPLHDMSATPDGKLAILSDGTGQTSRCVKLFDSETGYISSTRDFDIAKPLSLGVTLRHQYVILGDNEQGERQITVVDKDGRVEHTHVIKEEIREKQINPSRITCGGRFIFVIGKLGGFAYEIKDTGINVFKRCFSFTEPGDTDGVDISANALDDLLYSCTAISMSTHKLRKWAKDKEIKSSWTKTKVKETFTIWEETAGADKMTRVSTRASHTVMSNGQTIRVYKE